MASQKLSHPAWVCGLKHINHKTVTFITVTPCVGVWIETHSVKRFLKQQICHTLRGCVD